MNSEQASYPLSAAQTQLLAGQLLSPDNPLCNMALACTIDGPIDVDIMQRAWREVASNSDALRMRIVINDQHITQSTGHDWPSLDIFDFSQHANPQQHADSWMQQCVSTAIAPDAVLGRVALIKLTTQRWIFCCNLHHVICDATSFASMWQDLVAVYGAIQDQTDRPNNVLAERSEFLAFVSAATELQQSRAVDPPDYLDQLQNIAPPAPFGCRPERADTASTRVSQPLSAERAASLATLSSLPEARGFGPGIGHCSVLLTILATLLYRIGGGSTQTIGLPLPQRQSPDFKRTLGLFIEVLPLQVSINEDTTFLSLVQQSRAAFLGLLKGGSAGDSALLEAHAVPAILNYINAPMGNFGDWPTQINWLHSGHIDSQHLVRLQVEDWAGKGDLSLSFDFNDAVFNNEQRVQAIDAFWHLFDAMSANVNQRVEAVPIVNHRLLIDPNHVASNRSGSLTIFHRINEHINSLDAHPALKQGSHSITYKQLGQRVQNCAATLRLKGVERGSRVAVYLPRDIRLPQVLLGIHACGASYVPIDSNQPLARINEMLSNACPEVLVTIPELAGAVDITGILMVDDLLGSNLQAGELRDQNITENNTAPTPTDVAYVMYTSGSTGIPKGVAVSHKSLSNYANWAADFYANNQAVDMALFTPIGFDLTVTSLYLPLMTGGTLHIYDEQQYSTVEALGAVIKDDAADIIKLTPSHLSLLTDEQCQSSKRLSQFIVGGEDLSVTLAKRIDTLFGGRVRIHNEYGPTEATVGCVLHTFNPDSDTSGSVPIGLPIAGSSLRVLNAAGEDQLPGCSGELYVGGASLANGYWQQASLTQSAFKTLPPNEEQFYRTGDLVREDIDGKLYYQGRVNEQFKLRGHRIEPAEIESAALQHPALTACVAVLTSLQTAVTVADKKCSHCGLSSRVPGAMLNDAGVCQPCQNFEKYQERVESYFRPIQEFQDTVAKLKQNQQSEYDCIMLLSGGKDSSYALAQLVDMGLNVLALTLDNGFISDSAKDNAAKVCAALGVEHRYASTPSMNAIFLDSLQRHANVCNGCFKTIYTFALQLACELGINCIVTGLSRGQFFETRLSEDWFMAPDYQVEAMDAAIVAARKSYHRMKDAVSCAIDTDFLQDDAVFERIQILDFYRYCDVSLDQMYAYLDSRLPWVRPTDTGRSTNCLINDAGIYVHRYERGYHNYANPYSWDVRLGHKERDAALDELDDAIDEEQVLSQLAQIGYQLSDKQPEQIALYYVADDDLAQSELKHWLATRLPEWMVPVWLIELPSIPLSANGKIDRRLLPVPTAAPTAIGVSGVPRALTDGTRPVDYRSEQLPPRTQSEQLLARIWCRHLRIEAVGVNENFFALGGDSLMAIRIVSEMNQAGYPYKPADLFEYQTIAQLAHISVLNREQKGGDDSHTVMETDNEKPVAFSGLSGSQLDALSRVMKKSRPK